MISCLAVLLELDPPTIRLFGLFHFQLSFVFSAPRPASSNFRRQRSFLISILYSAAVKWKPPMDEITRHSPHHGKRNTGVADRNSRIQGKPHKVHVILRVLPPVGETAPPPSLSPRPQTLQYGLRLAPKIRIIPNGVFSSTPRALFLEKKFNDLKTGEKKKR